MSILSFVIGFLIAATIFEVGKALFVSWVYRYGSNIIVWKLKYALKTYLFKGKF